MAPCRFPRQIARRHRDGSVTHAPRARRGTACEGEHVTPILADEVNTRAMSDADDVRRVLAGDVDAFAALVDRYYDRCARFAVRMLGNRDDAEDALQATFLRAYRALGRYQERDKRSEEHTSEL